MKISIKVKAGAKTEKIERLGENSYKISVKAPAKEGKANEALIKALADYFEIPRSSINIVSGHTSSQKIIEIIGG